MPNDFVVSEDVKVLVNDILKKYDKNGTISIQYTPGSEVGDGYVSRTVAADIRTEKELFRIFFKCALNIKSTDLMPIDRLYENEIYFYNNIYPALLELCKEHGFEDGLRNIPKCYGTAHNILGLENLKEKNFTVYERQKQMNDAHIRLALKAFAKMHAISFALKDQRKELNDKFENETFDFYSAVVETFKPFSLKVVNEFVEQLDPVNDKHLLDKCENLAENLANYLGSARYTRNEYSILTQGDSHCNNMMFLYQDGDRSTPIDIMLIDWQLIRSASVVYDLSYFLYPVATEETLDNLNEYLQFYHDELSEKIRLLGSDPDRLYPFEILKKEWKQHCKFGFMTSFNIVRIMLSEKEEVINMEDFTFDSLDEMKNYVAPQLKSNDEYLRRMKMLFEHMVKNDFLSEY